MMIKDYIDGLVPVDSEIRELCKPANATKKQENTPKTDTKKTKTEAKTMKNETKTEEKTMNENTNTNTNTNNLDEILSALMAQQRVLNEQIQRFAQMMNGDAEVEEVEVEEKATPKKTETKKAEKKSATKKSAKKGEIEGAKIVTFTDNAGNDRIAVCFEQKPSAAVRDALKKQGHFRFYAKTDNPNVKNAWVRKDSESAREALQKIAEAV